MTVDSAALEEFDYYEEIEEVDWIFEKKKVNYYYNYK